jgi:hypothetical protein
MPRILLVPAPPGLCARERSLFSLYNLVPLGSLHQHQGWRCKRPMWPCLSRSASSPILLPSVRTQAISGLFVAEPTGIPSTTTTTQSEVRRRRLFMRYKRSSFRLRRREATEYALR